MNVPRLGCPKPIHSAPVGQVGTGFTTQSTVWRSARGTFARILPRKDEAGQASSTQTEGAGLPPRWAALMEVAMDNERDDEATPPTWHVTLQESFRDSEPLDWQMCCVARVTGHDPLVVAAGLLADHPDSPTMVKRAMLFANLERQGPVWRVSHSGADFFNPYTGETVEHVMLPISVVPQGNPVPTLADVGPNDPTLYEKSQDQTAAGLRWAEAVRSVPTDVRGEIPWATRVKRVQEDSARRERKLMESYGEVESVAPQQIPHDYQPAVVATARVLAEAVAAAEEYANTHHQGVAWTNVEECLSPVATASAAFVAAYMMWRLSE